MNSLALSVALAFTTLTGLVPAVVHGADDGAKLPLQSSGNGAESAESAAAIVLLTMRSVSLSEVQIRQAATQVWATDQLSVARQDRVDPAKSSDRALQPLMWVVRVGKRTFSVSVEGTPFLSADDLQGTEDAAVRGVLEQHRGWVSVASVSSPQASPELAIAECSRLLAALLEQQAIPGTAICGVMLPADELVVSWSEIAAEAVALLRTEHPVSALRARAEAPILSAGQNAAAVRQAAEIARNSWSEFAVAFDKRRTTGTSGHSILAEFTEGSLRELMWLEVVALKDGRVYGRLANKPTRLRSLREGAELQVSQSAVLDWVYVNASRSELHGAWLAKQLTDDLTAAETDRAGVDKSRQ
jgi:uncharacterized protein YegJ (DUF2314 family)